MKRCICTVVFAILSLIALSAIAQPRIYGFGGSGLDRLEGIAADEDGRIVMTGWAESTDGTLAGRDDSGHVGWVLCVDAQGNEVWSTCVSDDMAGGNEIGGITEPMFCEDGSFTACVSMYSAAAVLRFDKNGALLERMPAQRRANNELIAKAHVMRNDGNSGGYQLFAVDLQGNETPIATAAGVWRAIASLEDGGVVGCGFRGNGGMDSSGGQGVFTRWNAQGNVVFETTLEHNGLGSVARMQNGFVAVSYPLDMAGAWNVVFFNGAGQIRGQIPLEPLGLNTGMSIPVTVLPDGSVALVNSVWPDPDNQDCCNGYLCIIPKEDIP